MNKGDIIAVADKVDKEEIFQMESQVKIKDKENKNSLKGIDLSHLEESKQSRILKMLSKWSHLFVEKDIDLKAAKVKPLNIDTGNSKPITQKGYRIPMSLREQLRKDIKNQLDNDIIRPLEYICFDFESFFLSELCTFFTCFGL